MKFCSKNKKRGIFINMAKKIIISEDQLLKLIVETNLIEEGAKMKCSLVSYEAMNNFLGDKSEKIVGHNTIAQRLGEFEIGIKYHNTYIIRIDPTDIITISSGGWDTKTTKERLNNFLSCRNVHITQKKYKWTIHGTNDSLDYIDGMQVFPNGHIAMPIKR